MSAAVHSPVGVSLISFWPGDPEVSILRSTSADSRSSPDDASEEAALDAMATEILKSNSRPHICVLLEPLVPGLAQFISETSKKSDFMAKVISDQRVLDSDELYNRYCSFHCLLFKKNVCALACRCVCTCVCVCLRLYTSVISRISLLFSLISRERLRHRNLFRRQFLVESPQQHQEILTRMSLEHFSLDPCFSNLRNNMRELVEVLAAVAAALPQQHYGFYRSEALL